MKLINTTKRSGSASTIQTTPISGLPPTEELNEKSLFLVDQFIKKGSYSAKKIQANDLLRKLYLSSNNTFKVDYWHTHLPNEDSTHANTSPYKGMVQKIKQVTGRSVPDLNLENSTFVEHINYDFNLLRMYSDARDDELQEEIDDINSRMVKSACSYDPNMVVTTTKLNSDNTIETTHESVNHSVNVDDTYCQMTIANGNKISNAWVCPATGNLSVVGWVDSSSALNNKAIPTSYCVLEADINSGGNAGSQWEVIAVQSVVPAKNITYVGFNVPVNEGLKVRVRTGFVVGAKSGQYSNEQDGYDTLSNSTPNGFKCQIWSRMD